MDKRVDIFNRKTTGIEHRVAYLVLLVTYVAGIIIAFCRKDLQGIGLMGMIVFLGSMIAGSLFSEKGDLSSGEVRRSITISFMLIFFALLAFGDRIDVSTENSVITKALDNFWVFIVTIIGFYFGGRSLERAAEKNRKGTGN